MSVAEAPDRFFDEVVISNTDFEAQPTLKFGFRASSIMLSIFADGPVEWSFTGTKRHGKIYIFDKFASFDRLDDSQIWLRVPNGNPTTVRVWAWKSGTGA